MQATIRRKLVLLSLLILVVVSFAFTLLNHAMSRAWVEEDLRERAVNFAREIAATIGDRREFESRLVRAPPKRHKKAVPPKRQPHQLVDHHGRPG